MILQRAQFSSFSAGDPNAVKFPIPDQKADWQAWLDCVDVVTTPIGGDSTQGATNYHSCAEGQFPKWADPEKMTATIGPFRFYRL